MKHIAPQLEIRWDEPEGFRLEMLKAVDVESKPTEIKTVEGPELFERVNTNRKP